MKWTVYLFFLPFCLCAGSMEERVETLEKHMGQVSVETPEGTYGANIAPQNFERGWVGMELFGGPLYWHAKVGGTEYVYSQATGKGKVESQSFDWDFGYRVGAGIFFSLFDWELLGMYTHYGSQDTEGKGVIPPSLLVNLKGNFFVFSQNVKSTYDIAYDSATLELRRGSFLGLGSSIGVKQTWMQQEQRVTYSAFSNDLTKVKDRCRFRGTGPQIGMHFDWNLFYKISLFGGAKAALLYGLFEVKHTESPLELKADVHLFSPNLSFLFGLKKAFPLEKGQLSFSLAYEADYYWRQNQMLTLEDRTSRLKVARQAEDLTFYGFTGSVILEF